MIDYLDLLEYWKSTPTFNFYENISSFKVINPIGDEKIIFKFALPGVKKEDIDITIHNNAVEISSDKDTEFVKKFTHGVSINGYDKDSLKHSFENGVLVLEFEKKEEFKPKKIKL